MNDEIRQGWINTCWRMWAVGVMTGALPFVIWKLL